MCYKKTVEKINEEFDKILLEAEKYAIDTLNNHKKELKLIVAGLMNSGILSKKELDEILAGEPERLFKEARGDIFVNI